jgi:hypothetical protein
MILAATVTSFAAVVGLPQEPGLEVMHVPAPEFPSPAGLPLPTTDLAGGSISGPPPGVHEGASATPASPPGQMAEPGANLKWINSRALSMKALRGDVVMIDFWDPTSISCIRTSATNKLWWDRYRKYGFDLIGVEDPEFDIPGLDIRSPVKRFGLAYPILVNAHFWALNAYKNNTRPNRFLIDASGYIRYHVAGEGHDAEFERVIQKLLKEAHPEITFPPTYTIAPDEDVFAPGCGGAPTPQVYMGDWHGRGALANPEGYRDGESTNYQPQTSVKDGRVVLQGRWETNRDDVVYRGNRRGDEPGNDRVTLRYHARELYAVVNVLHGHTTRLYIMQDDSYLSAANKGIDVQIDTQGKSYIEVREPRMYYVVQNPAFGSHSLALFPTRPGLGLYSLSFSNDCQMQFAHGVRSPGTQLQQVNPTSDRGTEPANAPRTFVEMTSAELAKAVPELKDLQPADNQDMLPQILERVGATVATFFHDFLDTTCTEHVTSIVHTEFRTGGPRRAGIPGGLHDYEATYNYVALAQADTAKARLREFRTDQRGRPVESDAPNEVITSGFAAMCEHFHPVLQPDSRFRYLGREVTEKREAYVVAFAQRPKVARRFSSIEFAGRTVIAYWQGICWIDPATFTILRLRTDLQPPQGDADILKETTDILYSPVDFERGGKTLWLPREVTVTGQLNQYLFRNQHRYSNYRLFKVEVEQKPGS